MPSSGRSGPSARTRSRTGFVSTPSTSAPSPSTIPSAWRRPNSTRTASPGARSASPSGTRYEYGRLPAAPAASTATATIRTPVAASLADATVTSSDAGSPVGVSGLLGVDDLVDVLGGLRDLARLVSHDVVVVLLARELERGVALPDVQLVRGLGGARPQALEQVLEGRRNEEDEERLRHLLLDHGRALDVDLQDRVASRRERLADLVARRPVPVAVHEVRLEEAAGHPPPLELVDAEEVVVHAVDLVLAAWAGRARDDEPSLRSGRDEAQRLDHRVLPDPRGARHDDQERPGRAGLGLEAHRAPRRLIGVHRRGLRPPEADRAPPPARPVAAPPRG